MANPYGSNGLAFASGQLQDKFAVVFVLRLEDSEWRASVGQPPIREFGCWRSLGNSNVVEAVIKGL
jgi:hypothetical protein